MLDFTKNIKLEPAWQKIYLVGRILVYIIFIFSAIFFLNRTLFPSLDFSINLNGQRVKENPLGYENTSSDESLFSAYTKENFSIIDFQIITKKNQSDLSQKQIAIRKTYSAFSYPEDESPASFPNGSLLKNSKNFFLVSDGKIRKFAGAKIISALGYTEENFQDATTEEIEYSEKGEDIISAEKYPSDSLFLIDNTYYKLSSDILHPFVSEKAFLSYFEKSQALTKDEEFLKKYTVNQDNPIGFANGTLLSFDIGVFLVIDEKVVPFNNPETFLALGYNWEDIIPANEEEIGLYQRDKVFSISRPHPSGTVFFAQDSNKYYLIFGQSKKEIRGENILKIYSKRKPIIAQEKSLEFQTACALQKKLWPFNSYGCKSFIENLGQAPGKDYQFKIQSSPDLEISATRAVFSKKINWLNLRDTLSIIKQRFLTNYGYGTTN
ncbi:MAG TPA: hypothetical protein P5232_00755 [Candidatus Moranbacteria bacterium]|nr:hypothetical protein [Candidatus Moranbacteria bacterium]